MTGSAYCWGSNGSGALGAEEISWSLEPLAVNAAGVLAGKTVTQVDAGHYHSCAVTSDGGVQCWGYNSEGQLGNASITSSYIPVAVDVSGALSGKSVTQVTAGYLHSCAVTSDGGAYCWGYNHYQVLGTNSPDSSLTPLAVERSGALAGKTVTQVSSHDYHACALTSDGGVYCWGMNWYGMLGNNSLSSSGVPVAVVDTNGVLSGKTLAQVSVGLRHSCVVASDGSTYCWGSNDNGELGDNTTSSSRVPVAVTPVAGSFNAPKPVMSIAAGGYMTLAIYGFAVRPGAPSGLVAVGAPGALELSWQPPVMAGGSPVTQYWVFYRPTGLTTWKVFARGISTTELPLSTNATQPGPCSGAASCPRLHGSLQVGTSYDFQLVAVNSSGNGRWSNMVTVLWIG